MFFFPLRKRVIFALKNWHFEFRIIIITIIIINYNIKCSLSGRVRTKIKIRYALNTEASSVIFKKVSHLSLFDYKAEIEKTNQMGLWKCHDTHDTPTVSRCLHFSGSPCIVRLGKLLLNDLLIQWQLIVWMSFTTDH